MQPSTIEAQSTLGANLLSQAFGSAFTNPSLANPPKEPIMTKSVDASGKPTTEDENPSNLPHDVTRVSS